MISARIAAESIYWQTTVTKTIPSYLRIHNAPNVKPTTDNSENVVQRFWQDYTEATGWRIDSPETGSIKASPAAAKMDPDNAAARTSIAESAAQRLADSASNLTNQLGEAREALRRQTAELAARAAILDTSTSQRSLTDQLTETLEAVTTACGCDAAQMFLLNENTDSLAPRHSFGLPDSRLAAPSRSLQGSRGDLEAMVQGIVLIDDLADGLAETWSCPEDAGAAICVSIENADVPVGTIWIYSQSAQQFGSAQKATARLAASKIGMLLQQASQTKERRSSTSGGDVRELAQWQMASLPVGTQLAPGWRVDGMIESPKAWATGWHHWDVLPDGTLTLVIAEADESSIAGAMTATTARAAMIAHSGYRHTPRQILQRVSDTLWQTNTCDQLTSLLYARVDPETGEGELAAAGHMMAMVSSRYGFRPIIRETAMPLASKIDADCVTTTFRMLPGEVFFANTLGLETDGANQTKLGNLLRGAMQQSDLCPLASIRRHLVDHPLTAERGAVTILRQ